MSEHTDIMSNDGRFILDKLYGVTDSLGYLYCNEHAFCAKGETFPVYSSGPKDEPCDSCGKIVSACLEQERRRLDTMKKIETGTKVAYSVQFLRSIGMSHSDMARARGIVTGTMPLGSSATLADVAWDRDMPARVNVLNLAPVGLNRKFSNVD